MGAGGAHVPYAAAAVPTRSVHVDLARPSRLLVYASCGASKPIEPHRTRMLLPMLQPMLQPMPQPTPCALRELKRGVACLPTFLPYRFLPTYLPTLPFPTFLPSDTWRAIYGRALQGMRCARGASAHLPCPPRSFGRRCGAPASTSATSDPACSLVAEARGGGERKRRRRR